MKAVKALVVVAFVLVAACGETVTGQTRTTGATCLSNHIACHLHSECCSQWCVNGTCERREP
jgi:hypothetical protein